MDMKGMTRRKGKDSGHYRHKLNVAIVGGDEVCKFFLELVRKDVFSHLEISVLAVCDMNPETEGYRYAKQMGIYTTSDFRELFRIPHLDSILELTNRKEVIEELIKTRPKGVGILEHNIGALMRSLFIMNKGLLLAEQKLDLEKGISDFLIHQANERIVILRPNFTIMVANDSYLSAVQRSRERAIGDFCYKMTHALDAPCSSTQPGIGCPLVETLRTGESAHVIHEHPTSEGGATYCDMVTYPIKDPAKETVAVIEIWRDITQDLASRVEARVSALKSDFAKLIQEDRMISLGKLVASSVHEINNPLQGLLTFAGLMQDILEERQPNPEELDRFRYFLSLMSVELERCGKIVSGLLSFARQSRREQKYLALNDVLGQVIALTKHRMEMQDIELEAALCADTLEMEGDSNHLQQCLLNLLFNSIEAMPEGGKLRISSELDAGKNHALIEIRDTGVGIPRQHLDHIYDPFFTTKPQGQGTGLGLSTVHGIVKAHKGHIEVESEVGKGTSFRIRFPLKAENGA